MKQKISEQKKTKHKNSKLKNLKKINKILKNKKLKNLYPLLIIILIIGILILITYPAGSKFIDNSKTFKLFPRNDKAIIYSYISKGDIRTADQILENKYEVSRFDPVVIDNITWKEDPYSDIYWRFNFYNLEPARNLLYAWQQTDNPAYKDKLIDLTASFIDNGMDGPYSWDYHGTAFRTMTLINIREKLQKKRALPKDLDTKILQTLKVHGDFLADPAHFEDDYNHGLDQSAALYLLAVNYPDIQGSDLWLTTASKRISEMLSDIVDDDGVLVENSPYYHIYVLEKFWEIKNYLKRNHLKIDDFSDEKINKVVSYVVYMLQPDLSVPTIGASLKEQINLFGPFREMAQSNDELLYVLTKGVKGKKPSKLNIRYPIGGQTIMRSGWGKEEEFNGQTQLLFDVGSYRTNHSDLDALSFNLFGNGIALMPDAGLYTYEAGPYRSYFHGTRSHNTVVVDGKDQGIDEINAGRSGKVYPGFFTEGKGYVYQSGESELYEGVSHKRAVAMIEDSTILIFDDLNSSSTHTYEQMFHLFPGAEISFDGLALTAKGSDPKQSLTIKQFIANDVEVSSTISQENPMDGYCSFKYGTATPCYSIAYTQKGKDISYVTVISIGQDPADVNYNKINKTATIKTKTREYTIKANITEKVDRKIAVDKNFETSRIYSETKPIDILNNYTGWYASYGNNGVNGQSIRFNSKENSLKITPSYNGSYFDVEKKAQLNLLDNNIYFNVKINSTPDMAGMDLYLSNNNWQKETRYSVTQALLYQSNDRSGEWLQFGAGKGDLRKIELGNWEKKSPDFDWSKIDRIKFSVASKRNKNISIDIKDFTLVPDQKSPKAVIIFDDGWASVLDALNIMEKYGVKGNVAVITDSVSKKNYLTLEDLIMLRDKYDWDLVSHSSLHKDAVKIYSDKKDLSGFENDIVDALEYLIQNDLNTAPNWYIFPNGSTNESIKQIAGKYYKFARATQVAPVTFPYAEPLEIGVLPIYSDRTKTIDVHNAISDTINYNQTIFLMFHKLSKGSPSVYTEYSLEDFETIIKDIKEQDIKVLTLSELDKENSIPKTKFTLQKFEPSQFSLDISTKRLPGKLLRAIIGMWNKIIDPNHLTQNINT